MATTHTSTANPMSKPQMARGDRAEEDEEEELVDVHEAGRRVRELGVADGLAGPVPVPVPPDRGTGLGEGGAAREESCTMRIKSLPRLSKPTTTMQMVPTLLRTVTESRTGPAKVLYAITGPRLSKACVLGNTYKSASPRMLSRTTDTPGSWLLSMEYVKARAAFRASSEPG